MNPRTSAACLNNIRRCLKFLKKSSNKINPNNLLCEDKILEGNPIAISGVVDEIYKSYHIAIRSLEKQR